MKLPDVILVFKKENRTNKEDFNAQHCLINLLEKWRQFLHQSLAFGALLTDLLKVFDCLSLQN